jgi:hypothetical protein
LWADKAFVWTFPGFFSGDSVDLESVVSAGRLRNHKVSYILAVSLFALVPFSVCYMGLGQLLPRAVVAFVAVSAVHACRLEWTSGLSAARDCCCRIMLCALLLSASMLAYDLCTLAGTYNLTYLLLGCGLEFGTVRLAMQVQASAVLVEALLTGLLLSGLVEAQSAGPLLRKFRLDIAAVVQDLQGLGCQGAGGCLSCLGCLGSGVGAGAVGVGVGVVPFSGTARRLNHSTYSPLSTEDSRSSGGGGGTFAGGGGGGPHAHPNETTGIML